ncbi:Non-structural maintenance of chromosomes element 1 [Coemansia spiralis]|nr:Non-structural maintenance of chromosomes element 1 [Coemansia spiralis]
MLELITTDDGYAIDLHRAVREAAAKCPAGHSRRDAEDIIDRLDADGWLAVETQWVGIGQRACIELQPYLTDAYPDSIRTCCLCKEMATRGVVCAACNEALHPHCAERLASDSAALSCPACRQRMDSPEQFGPRRDRSSGAARQKSETPL